MNEIHSEGKSVGFQMSPMLASCSDNEPQCPVTFPDVVAHQKGLAHPCGPCPSNLKQQFLFHGEVDVHQALPTVLTLPCVADGRDAACRDANIQPDKVSFKSLCFSCVYQEPVDARP